MCAVESRTQDITRCDCARKTENRARRKPATLLIEQELDDSVSWRSKRQTDADFLFAQRDLIGEQAVSSKYREKKGDPAERHGHLHQEYTLRNLARHFFRHALEPEDRRFRKLGLELLSDCILEQASVATRLQNKSGKTTRVFDARNIQVRSRFRNQ